MREGGYLSGGSGFSHVKDYWFQGIHRFSRTGAWCNEQLFLDDPLAVRKIHGQHSKFFLRRVEQSNDYGVSVYNFAYVRCDGMQDLSQVQTRRDFARQIEQQLEPLVLLLRTFEIQAIIQCERDDTPDEVQEGYLLFTERIHRVTVDSENTQPTMWRRQWGARPIYRAMRGWLYPYVRSRVLPGDFHPITSYLFVEYKCNLDCWSFDNPIKGMAEDVARRVHRLAL